MAGSLDRQTLRPIRCTCKSDQWSRDLIRTRTAGLVGAMMPCRLCCPMVMCAHLEGAEAGVRR